MNTPTAPIGIYVRVSRKGDREDDRFHSPKEQVERATALAAAKGYVVGPTFEDIDVSGATLPQERPAMGRLLEAIRVGTLGGIAAYSLDRLSREPAHGDALVREVTKAGGVILTPDIPDAIDTPTGEFTFGMLLQVAKLYRSQAGARFASAKERSIKAGIPVGTIPVGYRARPDRRLEVDPDLAPVVRDLFERRARGESWFALSEILTEALGRPMPREAVEQMIKNLGHPVPAATAERMIKDLGRPVPRATVERIIKNRIYATGRLQYGDLVSDVAADAIVDEPLWHAAQSTRMQAPRSDLVWLLTGLLRCGTCGRKMAPWRGAKHRDGKLREPVRRYKCPDRACTARASVDANKIERVALLQSVAVGDEIERLEQTADFAELRAAVEQAERRLSQVLAPEARDALGDLWAADVKARRAERDAAFAKLGAAREAHGIVQGRQDFWLADRWDGMTAADRRAAMSLFWKEIRVTGSKFSETTVTLVPRGPGAVAETDLQKEEA